jgi:hypothetical protein
MKKIIIATAITCAIIIACSFALPACAEVGDRGEFYPRLAVVTAYEQVGDTDLWVIYCTDKDGEVWSFYGEEEDAHIGMMYNLLMWNMGEAEEEDEIIEVYYEGRMDTMQMAQWLSH